MLGEGHDMTRRNDPRVRVVPSVAGQGVAARRWRGVLALSTLFMLALAGYALMFFAISLYNGA